MGGGNGAKAAQKRERALKDAKGGAVSQLKVNEKAMNKKCATCMQPFLQTANKKVRSFFCFVSWLDLNSRELCMVWEFVMDSAEIA